jgi:hypothetical protein
MNQKMAFGVCIQGIMAENAVENLEKVFINPAAPARQNPPISREPIAICTDI